MKDAVGEDALSLEEMQIGLEVAQVALGRVDYLMDTVTLDTACAAMFGFEPGVAIPRAEFHSRIHPEDWPTVAAEVDLLLAPGQPDVIDVTHRIVPETGEMRWVHARKRVWVDETDDGRRPVRGVFAVVDVTETKTAQMHSEYLIRELNHRTKNLMSVVGAIARQVARHSAPEEVVDNLVARIGALARNQDAMVEGPSGHFELGAVIREQLTGVEGDRQHQVQTDGPRLSVAAQPAQTYAMVIHELLTNSLKYGALSVPEGQVALRWRVEPGPQVLLEWSETGGPPVVPPEREGFGSQLLRRYAEASLSGTVGMAFDPGGLRFSLRAPLSALND